MQWLFENPLANMPGPAFLGFFGALLVGAMVLLRIRVSQIEQGDESRPLAIPDPLDPYQIAYLRGGDPEVIRTAMVDLVEQGRLVEVPKTGFGKNLSGSTTQWKAADETDTGLDLSPIQRTVLRFFNIPKAPESVFQSGVGSRIQTDTRLFREWMDREKLGVDSEDHAQLLKLLLLCLVGIEALGGYKLLSAYFHSRPNVLFLIGMMIFGAIIIPVCAKHRRLTQRGRDFLRDLQTAFVPLRTVKNAEASTTRPMYSLGDASVPLMAMGIFGVSALQGSEFDPLYRSYQKAAANSSGCSSCGSTGCGSSSSDSGSGSSCGSSCGGGGCGGCGGGD